MRPSKISSLTKKLHLKVIRIFINCERNVVIVGARPQLFQHSNAFRDTFRDTFRNEHNLALGTALVSMEYLAALLMLSFE